jgi:hypothetical protein
MASRFHRRGIAASLVAALAFAAGMAAQTPAPQKGPAAPAMTAVVPDLTTIARR